MTILSTRRDAKPQNYTPRESVYDFSPPCVAEVLSPNAQRTALLAVSRAAGLTCGAEGELRPENG